MNEAEREFHRAMVAIYETAKRELGYNATRFLQMLSEQGGLTTARQLLWSDTPSDGSPPCGPTTGSTSPSKHTYFSRLMPPCSPTMTASALGSA